LNNSLLCNKKEMYWQEIIVLLIIGYSIYFIFNKYFKKEEGCKDSNCDC
jgi:hypothetical protein